MGRIGKALKKRHKKLKSIDPLYNYTGDKRIDRANRKDVKSTRPHNFDEQEKMSHSFKEMIRLKNESKTTKGNRHRKKNKDYDREVVPRHVMERGMSRPLKPVPDFTQQKGEKDKVFMQRVENQTREVLTRTQMEEAYQIDIEEEGGEVKIVKRKGMNAKSKKRLQLKKEKLKDKKATKRNEKYLGFEHLTDKVQFGEVAMEPPTLTAKPRQMQEAKSNRPGRKSLLLKEALDRRRPCSDPGSSSASSKRTVGHSVKRKNLSVADKRIMDGERERAIEMYRQMKKQKLEQNTNG